MMRPEDGLAPRPLSHNPGTFGHSVNGPGPATASRDAVSMVTISTSQGLIHVPVDTHQASRLADEKRARNAGASARFRQRRKDKEREASTNIDRLQQQARDLGLRVRDVEVQRDFYRDERNRLRDMLLRMPGIRPADIEGPPSPGGRLYQTNSQYSMEGGMDRPPRRQRTNTQGDFLGVAASAAPTTSMAPVSMPAGSLPPPPLGPHNLPPLRIDSHLPTGVSLSASTMEPHTSGTTPSSAGPLTPYDPAYRRGGYDRPWQGDAGDPRRS